MQKPSCRIISFSDFGHLQQIYTGFFLLHKKGVIKLSQTIRKIPWRRFEELHVKVILNDELTLYYDMHDCGVILPEYMEGVDFYFKRSFSPKLIENLPDKEKVFPYGLNYENTAGGFDKFLMARSKLYAGKEKLKILAKSSGLLSLLRKNINQFEVFEGIPRPEIEPKVIFMARAWDTEKIEDKTQKSQTEAINENRAACVRLLRKEFGQNFFGGLAVDDYSAKNFRDCLLPDRTISSQKQYLELLKNFPICVATTGLCGSNGWKLSEYVALSKAIVSEKLQYEAVGNFEKDKNYLEFETPEQCVEKTVRLFEDKNMRERMMKDNFDYYQNYLRPDKIVLNTLAVTGNFQVSA